MTNVKVFLAVAGAGKTYTICNTIDPLKRNLILSYTHENIINITTELTKKWGNVPKKTRVMTFDYFLVSAFIRPFLNWIQRELFGRTPERIARVDLFPLPPVNPVDRQSLWLHSQKNFCHYFSGPANDRSLRLDTCSELPLLDNSIKNPNGLFQMALNRLNNFFDCYYIDEFQDYRQSNFDLMVKMMQNVPQGFLYGDYYQHSVSGANNTGKPFGKSSTYDNFKKDLWKLGFVVDENSLSRTRRCAPEVCNYIRSKLQISIFPEPSMGRKGSVNACFTKEALFAAIQNGKTQFLTLKSEPMINSITFGASKGDTFENTIVVLPNTCIMEGQNGCKELKVPEKSVMKNKIYVALTRATGNVYLTDLDTTKACFSMF
jgi:DNA helicase-2/ATP-dependent DNA helicase PcrA